MIDRASRQTPSLSSLRHTHSVRNSVMAASRLSSFATTSGVWRGHRIMNISVVLAVIALISALAVTEVKGCNILCDGIHHICHCKKGYTGTDCSIDIDYCSPNPCENQGTCEDRVEGYTCSCVTGFIGDECKINVDDCSPNPCQNGGTCEDLIDDYQCRCVPGYYGKSCEVETDECGLHTPCRNGATCMDRVNDYTCSCMDGWTGKNCNIDIDECAPRPCRNGATCVNGLAMYSCTCAPEYTGRDCEDDFVRGGLSQLL